MRASLLPRVVALATALLGAWPVPAGAHGGLPLSTAILGRDQALYVPTQYWGIFVGTDGGPWRWICDEAINNNLLRSVHQGGDGTLYATDLLGMTLSHDGGCTWEAVPDEMARRQVTAIVPDPAAPAGVFATTLESGQTALWRSRDAGQTWRPIYTLPDRVFSGLALSPDGQRVYLTALAAGPRPDPMLYVSTDGGMKFLGRPITPRPDLPRVSLLGADPRDGSMVYLRFQGDPNEVLVQADTKRGTFIEVLKLERPLYAVSADVARGRLLVPTGGGLYYADGDGPLRRSEGLSRAQCVSVRDGTLYACSWNFPPDLAAVARSGDGGLTFTPVFQFNQTLGIMECPAGTPVARICPQVWRTYAFQLGIGVEEEVVVRKAPPAPVSMGCGITRGGVLSPGLVVGLLLLAGVGVAALRRRPRRQVLIAEIAG